MAVIHRGRRAISTETKEREAGSFPRPLHGQGKRPSIVDESILGGWFVSRIRARARVARSIRGCDSRARENPEPEARMLSR